MDSGGEQAVDPATERLEDGVARRRRAQGPKTDRLHEITTALDPQFDRWIDAFIFGEVWGRPGLSQDERMLVAIAALAATEHSAQLRNYLWGALHAGIPAEKIHETLVMMIVYAGFPTALTALFAWRDVANGARAQGMDVGTFPDLPENP